MYNVKVIQLSDQQVLLDISNDDLEWCLKPVKDNKWNDGFKYKTIITDLAVDQQLVSVLSARKEEYRKIDEEFLNAIAADYAGDPTPITEYMLKRDAIKVKYPKPE